MPPFLSVSLALFGTASLLLLLWLLAAAPRSKRPEAGQLCRAHYAHRGLFDLSRGIPENSLPAFSLAAERGVGIELDVQLSSDGVPMVFHDGSLERACGVSGRLCETSCRNLKRLCLFGIPDARIPTLAEVLSLVDGRVPILVEIKEHPSPSAVAKATAKLLDGYRGTYLVEAFHPLALLWFRKNRPAVIRGQLSAAFLRRAETRRARYFVLQFFLLNFITRPDFIAYDLRNRDSAVIRLLRTLFSVPLLGWTARTASDGRVRGFDGLIFEGEIPPKPKGSDHEN